MKKYVAEWHNDKGGYGEMILFDTIAEANDYCINYLNHLTSHEFDEFKENGFCHSYEIEMTDSQFDAWNDGTLDMNIPDDFETANFTDFLERRNKFVSIRDAIDYLVFLMDDIEDWYSYVYDAETLPKYEIKNALEDFDKFKFHAELANEFNEKELYDRIRDCYKFCSEIPDESTIDSLIETFKDLREKLEETRYAILLRKDLNE